MIPDIRIDPMGTQPQKVIEEILAVLVHAKMLTVSGDIGDRINKRVAERRDADLIETLGQMEKINQRYLEATILPHPLTGDTV